MGRTGPETRFGELSRMELGNRLDGINGVAMFRWTAHLIPSSLYSNGLTKKLTHFFMVQQQNVDLFFKASR